MNKRGTIQRALVLNAVRELRGHASADEIYEHLTKQHPHISKGTVYRNLRCLSETADIRKVELTDGTGRYDHQVHDHYHARCVRCGRVVDAECDYMRGLESRIQDTQGFLYQGHDIVFTGICLECNTENERTGERERVEGDENRGQLDGGVRGGITGEK